MKCEGCGKDTHVERHIVDGYAGYLCDECHSIWCTYTLNKQVY